MELHARKRDAQESISNDTMADMRMTLLTHMIFAALMCPMLVVAQTNESIKSGFEIMTNKQTGNCIACHAVPGLPGLPSDFGPSLKGVGSRWRRSELMQWVVDARKIKSDTLMPPFGNSDGLHQVRQAQALLSNAQINDVVDTLASWR